MNSRNNTVIKQNESACFRMKNGEDIIVERNIDEDYSNEIFITVKRKNGDQNDLICLQQTGDGKYEILLADKDGEFVGDQITVPVSKEDYLY